MESTSGSNIQDKDRRKRKKSVIWVLVILAVGAIVTTLIFLTEPKAEREGASKETAMLVEVVKAGKGDYSPLITVTGVVQASHEINLSAQVGGIVMDRSPNFTPGGLVKQGEVLLQIDPRDYHNEIELRQSDLDQALSDLKIEMGRQHVAMKDYELIGENLPGDNKALVLREPQLQAAEARVKAARAALNQAKLNLDRSAIRAPFNAQVISRETNRGSLVNPGESLGRLVGMDNYWIRASVPVSKLRWLHFPDSKHSKGSRVYIHNRSAWKEGEQKIGHLYSLIGSLENQTRLAQTLVNVPDPLSLADTANSPSLIIGSFVEVRLAADSLFNVVRVNRDYLRQNETVWVMEDQKLKIRNVEVLLQDETYAYVQSGLNEGDSIVITNLATVVEGANLRLEEDSVQQMPDSLKASVIIQKPEPHE